MTRPGFVVEFLGLPGVGKTTLALEVAKLLLDLPVRSAYGHVRGRNWVVRRLYSTRDIVRLALQRPHYVVRSARAIQDSRQRSRYDGLKVTNNWLNVSALTVASGRAPHITLFDQGMFQALWSVGYSAAAAERSPQLADLGALMPRPDLVILLRADLATVRRRLHARGGQESRLDAVTHAEASQLEAAAALLDALLTVARAEAVALLEVDAGADDVLAVNARTVADAVRVAVQRATRATAEQTRSLSV